MTTNAATTEGTVHVPASIRAKMVWWAQWCAIPDHQKIFHYTQDARRAELFNTPLAHLPALVAAGGSVHADCSQWYASVAHGCGVTDRHLNQYDYTGTLLEKGTLVKTPKPGDCVIFGGGTGEHAAMITYNGFTIGFGHSPGAPNRVKLSDMKAYFKSHGHPGVRYLSFVS